MTQIAGETRMLIDGRLVEATGGRAYTNVNPATEEALGRVADASVGDMESAIAAARRAFDETDWSTKSGLGREHGLEGFEQYLQSKTLGLPPS